MATILDALRLLKAYGWRQEGREGDLRLLTHPARPGVKFILAGRVRDPLPEKSFQAILRFLGPDEENQ